MLIYQKPYLMLVIFTSLVVYTQQQISDPAFMETYNKIKAECAKEVNIDVEVINKVWKENHFPNDNNLKCYFKCLNLKLGVMTQTGDVVDDVLKKVEAQFTDNSTDREIVTECGAVQGADLCETAMKLMACVKKAELD